MAKPSASRSISRVRTSQSRKFSIRMRLEDRFSASLRKRMVLNGMRTVRRRCIRCRTSGTAAAEAAHRKIGLRKENMV